MAALAAGAPGNSSETPSAGGGATADRLLAAGGEELERLQGELARTARERFERLSAAGSWTAAEVDGLVELLLVDPARALAEPALLERVLPIAIAALPERPAQELVGEVLVRWTRPPGLELAALEEIETAWGTVARRGLDQRLAPVAGTSWPALDLGSVEGEIGLSIFSLGSSLFEHRDLEPFLRALRRSAPGRPLAILVDHEQEQALRPLAGELGLHLSRTWGRHYSPWPRDPMSFLLGPEGGRVAVLRPNRQPTRADDSFMGLELFQDLPDDLWERLGPFSWAVAPIPFHNGNILHTAEGSWISLHTLEEQILAILGRDRVPVESFGTATGVGDYLRAARQAADELGRVFGTRARFVHALPESGDSAAREAAMLRLGGGAGYDLDSLVTVLKEAPGGPAALVGDPLAGAELIAAAPADELRVLRTTYGFAKADEDLRAAVVAAQSDPATSALTGFLELVTDHLTARGFEVGRLPLLRIPTSLLGRPGGYPDAAFLLGWNNVVLESTATARRAEGFASAVAGGDVAAHAAFEAFGYELVLLPPLVESVLRNGGYRCASNHLRELD